MSDFAVSILISWILSAITAAYLGCKRSALGDGLCLGVLFGPFGVIAAGLLDGRPNCARCGGRQNVKPNGQRYEVCEHCGCDNTQPPSPPKRPTPALENDPDWEHSLDSAKRQLEQAGLIGSK